MSTAPVDVSLLRRAVTQLIAVGAAEIAMPIRSAIAAATPRLGAEELFHDAGRIDDELASERMQRLVERQRTLMTMLPPVRASDNLRAAMLERAEELIRQRNASGAMALLEFLPSADVDRLLARLEGENSWRGNVMARLNREAT